MLFPVIFSVLALVGRSHAINYCPLLGAVYPAPQNISSNALAKSTVASLTAALDQAVRKNKTTYGNFSSASNSFSISVVSTNEDKPIFQYQHTARQLDNASTTSVTGDTMFRIGSVSKLFTVFALLLQKGTILFDDPVTRYIPELADIAETQASGMFDPVSQVAWKDVTIGALASHLAGIGRDYNVADLAGTDLAWAGNAFPPLNSSDIPNCSVMGKYPACSREAFFRGFTARHPVLAPFTTPVYSNAGFILLGYVAEKVTGQPYEVAVEKGILKPLDMAHTSVTKPSNDSQGIIPLGYKLPWGLDYGNESPAGGMYSSTNDLSKLAKAILKSSLLKPVETRRWLKPYANTASLQASVGAPWEIQRVVRDTSDKEVIELYTKSGNTGLYSSLLVLIPDYEVAFTVLAAGDEPLLVTMLSEMIAQKFLPVIYQISKEETTGAFGGMYKSTGSINTTLSLIWDDGPGLLVNRMISNGTDLIAVFQKFGGFMVEARIYPTGLINPVGSNNSTAEVSWRSIFRTSPILNSSYTPIEIFNQDCVSWSGVDATTYGNNGLDDFVFQVDQHGKAVSVESQALRIALAKTS